jgi:hypothetical protein
MLIREKGGLRKLLIFGQVIKKQLADGVSIRRVGLVSTGAPARQHSEILTMEGKQVRPSCSTLCSVLLYPFFLDCHYYDLHKINSKKPLCALALTVALQHVLTCRLVR